jgi:hypothetical protein
MSRSPVWLSDSRYSKIESLIYASYPNACILYIDEIVNPRLDQRYHARREQIPGVKEVQGFHGTKETSVSNIISNGFDPMYAVRQAYGPGVYFANKAQYSSGYMVASKHGEPTFMFLADVLIGQNGVDNHFGPDIFTTVHADGSFPRYLIAFHKEAR